MKFNLNKTNGLIVAEAVMMALAPHIGRQVAHDIVYECCRESLKNKVTFIDALLSEKAISNVFNKKELEKVIDPSNYLGAAPAMAQRLLNNR
jgi:3-carboxy-cis,cis-muconate cycloisomerase